MTTLADDTSRDTDNLCIEQLRRMPTWRRLELMAEMSETVRTLALAGLRQRHPGDSESQRRRRLAGLLLGEALATRAYGPPPKDDSC